MAFSSFRSHQKLCFHLLIFLNGGWHVQIPKTPSLKLKIQKFANRASYFCFLSFSQQPFTRERKVRYNHYSFLPLPPAHKYCNILTVVMHLICIPYMLNFNRSAQSPDCSSMRFILLSELTVKGGLSARMA